MHWLYRTRTEVEGQGRKVGQKRRAKGKRRSETGHPSRAPGHDGKKKKKKKFPREGAPRNRAKPSKKKKETDKRKSD